MSSRAMKAGVVALALAVGAYWYWSPYLAMRSMKSAAEKKDADSFSEHVDYGKVRESLKGQFSAVVAGKLGEGSSSGSDASRAGAALGSMLALAMADKFVDAMVRPEAVMSAMQEAKLSPKPTASDEAAGPEKKSVNWTVDRMGVDKVIAYAQDKTKPNEKQMGLVFERSGFATWKLTEIRIPTTEQ